MKFCSQCGVTLPMFNQTTTELCSTCTQKLSVIKPIQPGKAHQDTDLFSATLTCKDGKIVLESKEGWLLWSGPDTDSHPIQLIFDQATRILRIRKRQKK